MGKYRAEIIHKGKVIALARWNSISCYLNKGLLPPDLEPFIYDDTVLYYQPCACQQKPTRALVMIPEGGETYTLVDICIPCRVIVNGSDFDDVLCTQPLCIKYGCSHFPRKGHPLKLKEDSNDGA